MWKDLGIKKQDSWLLIGQLAIELSRSKDLVESIHGDIWIDQCVSKFNPEGRIA